MTTPIPTQHPGPQPRPMASMGTVESQANVAGADGTITTQIVSATSPLPAGGSNQLPYVAQNMRDGRGQEMLNTLPSTQAAPFNLILGTVQVTDINKASPKDDLNQVLKDIQSAAQHGQVDQQDGDHFVVAPRARQQPFQLDLQGIAIEQAGQRVVMGHVGQPFRRGAFRRRVHVGGDMVRDLAHSLGKVVRLEIIGEQAQVDWGCFGSIQVGRATRSLSCFVMVLSRSRAIFARFFLDQRLESFLRRW